MKHIQLGHYAVLPLKCTINVAIEETEFLVWVRHAAICISGKHGRVVQIDATRDSLIDDGTLWPAKCSHVNQLVMMGPVPMTYTALRRRPNRDRQRGEERHHHLTKRNFRSLHNSLHVRGWEKLRRAHLASRHAAESMHYRLQSLNAFQVINASFSDH